MKESTFTNMRFQARALTAVQSQRLTSTWLVGTNALREENEVRLLQYDSDQERLVCIKALTHAPEIWDISTTTALPDLLITVWSQSGTYGASLWSMKGDCSLSKVADLTGQTPGIIRQSLWHPQQQQLALTVEEGALLKWDVSDEAARLAAQAPAGDLLQLWGGGLHPGNPDQAATAGGNSVQVWDLRSMAVSGELPGAHRMPCRDVCFAPGSSGHRLVSCGDDCKLRVWDMRQLGRCEALLELGGHSHWVWRAQYNPFHEQLLASASSDCLVNLYHTPHLVQGGGEAAAAAAAAAAAGGGAAGGGALGAGGDKQGGGERDGKVHSFDEHEDSVYGLAWSCADPWLLASLSYDGRVVLNKVPKTIKYNILI
ncbi:WD40-repeat-containing domain protein [Haematococcus lacustris]